MVLSQCKYALDLLQEKTFGLQMRGINNQIRSKLMGCDGEQDLSPSAQETLAIRDQPDRRAKTKEPGFHYMA